LIWSSIFVEKMSPSSTGLRLESVDTSAPTSRMLEVDRVTEMPADCTTSGSCDCTSCSLFCTCTCAMSGSMLLPKVRVTEARPVLEEDVM